MKSIFTNRTNDEILYESEHDFVIPNNVLIEINNILYVISRTVFFAEENKVIYLLRKKGDTLL